MTPTQSYRQIIKATSIFGGVQVFNILISIVRSKAVALFLGPAGMGIMGLLTSTIGILGSMTNCGLGTSAIKDIASAHGSENPSRIQLIVSVFRRLVWFTGLAGMLSAIILSPWLSQITFGNKDHTLAFVWISITLLFNQLTSGQLVILQGIRSLSHLAKANMVGSFMGLIITVPLYYFYRINGIVPGIIVSALIALCVSWFYSRKTNINTVSITRPQVMNEGSNMLRMGFLINLGALLSVAAYYLINIFISRTGGVEQVGLYTAGFAIINTYSGLIFNAMATDYYPRLSQVCDHPVLCRRTVNQQAEMALLIMAPVLIIFLVFIHWVIILLYSRQFIPANDMIYWATLGLFFKAISWSVAFIFLAKGAGKIFFWNELAFYTYFLGLNILGYHLWGLTGLGIAFTLSYIMYTVQVVIISKVNYSFSFTRGFLFIFILQFTLALIGFIAVEYLPQSFGYSIGIIMIALSGWYSCKELDKKLGFKQLWMAKMHK